jgi:lysozyme
MTLVDALKRDEGLRLKMYRDVVGAQTIGYGHNLDAKPISTRAAAVILDDDIRDAQADVFRELPWTAQLDPVRVEAFVNLAFNLGIYGLLKFPKFLAAAKARNWATAAAALQDSTWFRQVGDRGARVSAQILDGVAR